MEISKRDLLTDPRLLHILYTLQSANFYNNLLKNFKGNSVNKQFSLILIKLINNKIITEGLSYVIFNYWDRELALEHILKYVVLKDCNNCPMDVISNKRKRNNYTIISNKRKRY